MSTSVASGNLVIVDGNTPSPSVFWKGQKIEGVTNLKVINGVVTLGFKEDPIMADMAAAGVKIVKE